MCKPSVGARKNVNLLVGVLLSYPRRQPFVPRDVPTELKVVRQNPIRESLHVTVELLAMGPATALHFIEVRSDVLGFYMADRRCLVGDDEVGRATGNALWLICCGESFG